MFCHVARQGDFHRYFLHCIYCVGADIPIPIRRSIVHIPIEGAGVITIIPIRA